jgi:hypothetical protein
MHGLFHYLPAPRGPFYGLWGMDQFGANLAHAYALAGDKP